MTTFYNPYNFIPTPDRGDGGAQLPEGLRDGEPPGHHRWHDGLWSGEIAITIRTITPLLLTRERDSVARSEDEHPDHRHLEVATTTDPNGTEKVSLAPTQIKGMLRATYEAVTCSRFGVFEHSRRLGYRTSADDAIDLRPARLMVRGDLARIQVLDRRQGSGPKVPAEVAKVPAWLGNHKYPSHLFSGGLLSNGALVLALVRKVNYVWVVDALLPGNTNATTVSVGGDQRLVQGRLYVSGPNVGIKEFERLIILKWWDAREPAWVPVPYLELPPEQAALLARQYRDLVAEQRSVHAGADRNDIENRDGAMPWQYLGDEPGKTAWSRHLYSASTRRDNAPPAWLGEEQALPEDDKAVAITCWAQVRDSQEPKNKWIKRALTPEDIVMIRPVMISRLLHDSTPEALLSCNLRPASALSMLSPADRVFGWVAANPKPGDENKAHRAQLRVVGLVLPDAAQAVEKLDSGLTITPLSGPKPSQGRFYLGTLSHDDRTRPLERHIRRDQFFMGGNILRGRKTYPHQQWMVGKDQRKLRDLLDYQPPERPARQNTQAAEERRKQDSQNATLHEWVKPGVEFRAVLRIDNLNDLELGALVWVLDPAKLGNSRQPGRLKLGSGKPLGFGSVEVNVDASQTRLSRGRDISDRLRNLRSETKTRAWSQLAAEFEQAMPSWFDEVKQAVRAAAVGYPAGTPVHYPRPDLRSPGYEWFELNEDRHAHRSLPLLGGDAMPSTP